jgi:tripartite-type tricarboxylate transporter receptor subunit TctC
MKKVALVVSVLLGLLVGCSSQGTQGTQGGQAAKAAFPEKEITLVVPFAAGGASDATSRIIAKGMEEKLKKPVVIVNKPGGTGGVGMSFVQASPNDGYTMGYVPAEFAMHKALGLSDLEPSKFDLIGQATMVPAAVTVAANAPYNTIEEFIEFAKKNPGKVRVGNSGSGSIWHVAASAFANKVGVTFNDIPFDGAAPAVTALMGGHVDAVMVGIGEVKSGVEAKKLKVLAVMTAERDKNFPDVPTLKEKGIDVQFAGWGGFVVPKGTPNEVKTVLADALKHAVESEEFKKFADERSMIATYKGPEEFAAFVDEQFKYFNELIPTMKLK